MQSHKRITWLVFVVATLSIASRAEERPTLAPGARLRVTATSMDHRVVGTVITVDARSVVLRVKGRAEPVVVSYREITAIQRSVSRRSRGKGALIGAAIGAGIGMALGLATCGDNCAITRGAAAAILGGMGAGGGALLGAAVPPGERWKEIPWKQAPGAGGSRVPGSHRTALSISIRF